MKKTPYNLNNNEVVYRERKIFKPLIRRVVNSKGAIRGIWRPGKRIVIPQTKTILITIFNNPRDIILKGVVSNLSKGFNVKFNIPRIKPAKKR